MSDVQRSRWEEVTGPLLVVAAMVFLGAYAWPILDRDLDPTIGTACAVTGLVVWLSFGVDFVVRLALAEHRLRFIQSNWFDVLVLAVPFLRPLRALQVVVALSVLARRGGAFARGRVVASVTVAVGVVSFVAALAMLDAERSSPEANIENFGDALWWAAATVTTVGYGDRYPTTTEGRFVAIGLMVTGIALLGVVTAALASWFVEHMSKSQQAEQRTEAEISELTAQMQALRAELRRSREQVGSQRPPP